MEQSRPLAATVLTMTALTLIALLLTGEAAIAAAERTDPAET
jgi:hypothetical protein